jgi:hypothetical protein
LCQAEVAATPLPVILGFPQFGINASVWSSSLSLEFKPVSKVSYISPSLVTGLDFKRPWDLT